MIKRYSVKRNRWFTICLVNEWYPPEPLTESEQRRAGIAFNTVLAATMAMVSP